MFSSGSYPSIKVEFEQEDPPERVLPNPTTVELHGDEFWPLSGRPHFNVIIKKSYWQRDQLVVPAKMRSVLPWIVIPTSVTYCGKRWQMVYDGQSRNIKRFYSGWKGFCIDNNLKIGDACVFELMGGGGIKELNFRVQILRGDLPPEFLNDEPNGKSLDTPIVIV